MNSGQVFVYNTEPVVATHPVVHPEVNLPFKTVIEVGVNQGQDTPRFLTQDNMVLYGFEPVWSLVQMLNEKFKNDPRVHIIPCAVDQEAKFTTFNVAGWRDQGCSSLHEFADDLKTTYWQTNFYYTHKQKVMVMRLEDFCRMYNITNIDYIWVDAQGSDFAVLKGLGPYIDVVQAGRVEAVLNVNLYKREGNHVNDILPWLKDRGFEITSVEPDANPQQCEANIHFKRIKA